MKVCRLYLMNVDIFIHFVLFQDAFATSKSDKSVGHESTLITAAEFDFDTKWDVSSFHAILPLFVHSTIAKDDNDPNFFFRLLTSSFKEMAKGVLMFSASHNAVVKVFGLFHCLVGDLMGRAAALGRISPCFGTHSCPCCMMPAQYFELDARIGVEAPWRNSAELAIMSKGLGINPEDQTPQQSEMAFEIGMNFYPELLEYPGVELVNADCNDLMHCGGGELLKHMLKIMRMMAAIDKEIWKKLSIWVRWILKEPVRLFGSEPSF
jgi:hypothetical protein